MAKKMTGFKTKGMNRDLSVSAFNPEFAFENRNLRLSTNDGNTLMSWVNERGTLPLSLSSSISGTPIGTAVLNDKLVLFTTGEGDKPDHIYVLEYSNDAKTAMTVTSLYDGSLGFSTDCPIETLVSYEAKDIQKVYWTDNKNQPRVINIAADSEERGSWKDTTFDFVNTLQLQEEVTVEKKLGASGMFAPGVIQYAFTYYHKYGQETNIFYTSPLQYISYRDRGASPEDKVENAFQIVIKGVDTNFDYIRIYSIQRTSINATPICKRVQDIAIKGLGPVSQTDSRKKASYLDTGMSGNSIDPTELLFKGGESVIAKTMEQKDNTLFLGNLKITRHRIDPDLAQRIPDPTSITNIYRKFFPMSITTGNYIYANQLTSYAADKDGNKISNMTVPCGGFKAGEDYRLGIQFQHTTGKWSDPVWIGDYIMGYQHRPEFNSDNPQNPYVNVPIFHGSLNTSHDAKLIEDIYNAGYRRVRPVVVYPGIQDRNIICQGVLNPTMYTEKHRNSDKDLHAQSSWVFRPRTGEENLVKGYKTARPQDNGTLPYTSNSLQYNPNTVSNNIRSVEIQGQFSDGESDEKFMIDQAFNTLHSPDVEFDDAIANINFVDVRCHKAGVVKFTKTLSDIDIQTETPAVSSSGSGFVHNSFAEDNAYGITSGLFYDDYLVDDLDDNEGFERYRVERSPLKWMVYLWNKNGSLNNDINRPADKGVASAVLKKKIISNLRIADTKFNMSTGEQNNVDFNTPPQLFSSNENTILKLGDNIYRGNVDTLLMPDDTEGMYFAFEGNGKIKDGTTAKTEFDCQTIDWKTFAEKVQDGSEEVEKPGIWKLINGSWEHSEEDIGNDYNDLVRQKGSVRMKYKSTPHLVIDTGLTTFNDSDLAVAEVVRTSIPMKFGGTSKDALKENIWVPCGEPVPFKKTDTSIEFNYSYGDTYYQRYDCLKTYAFTPEDVNQVIEIGSFMLETRVNIDGRYDRNRGQQSNLYMSPQNFNLLNPVYSQVDNFFTYRIQDDDYYTHNTFPNQLTWSKTKESGAEVDMWTNMTLASILELDGSNGELNSLQRFNDQLIAFQDTGISQVLYNENVQVSSTDGVPIEIANSGKVQGKRYLSNTVGCTNKWSIVNTLSGIYFMDSHDKSIFLFNGQLGNLSGSKGFNAWAKQNIPDINKVWTPNGFGNFVGYYDKLNQDILFINSQTSLAFSERLAVFTSFYDYGNTPYFCNLENTGVWIRNNGTVWKHNAGTYCSFFNSQEPYSMILVGNPEPQLDKIFTNLEFRACVGGEGTVSGVDFTPYLPFNSLETWDEYQHGITTLSIRNGHDAFKHHDGFDSSLKRKFRIWRCDIPRDNASLALDDGLNVKRFKRHPNDRMRNPWLYLKLMKDAGSNLQTEIHDIVMTYFG